jgi:hypothetical protein
MIALQNAATVNVFKQTSIATNVTTASGVIDTVGFDHVAVDFWNDSAGAATNNPLAMWVCECDTSNGTFVAITGAAGDATDGFTIGAVSTSIPTMHRVNVSVKGRKRWLGAGLTPAGAATIVGITAVLSKAVDSTYAASKMGTFASVAG